MKWMFPKFIWEIIISLILAAASYGIIYYFTRDIMAGIPLFTAILVIINFIFSRYDARNEVKVDFKIEEKDGLHSFIVSLVNIGGKTVYLNKGGVKTKEGTIVDFDEEANVDFSPKPKESNTIFPFSLPELKLNPIKFPKMKLIGNVKPRMRYTIEMEVWEFMSLLIDKQKSHGEFLELKGFFIDQLGDEHESDEWMQISISSLISMAKKGIRIKSEMRSG